MSPISRPIFCIKERNIFTRGVCDNARLWNSNKLGKFEQYYTIYLHLLGISNSIRKTSDQFENNRIPIISEDFRIDPKWNCHSSLYLESVFKIEIFFKFSILKFELYNNHRIILHTSNNLKKWKKKTLFSINIRCLIMIYVETSPCSMIK